MAMQDTTTLGRACMKPWNHSAHEMRQPPAGFAQLQGWTIIISLPAMAHTPPSAQAHLLGRITRNSFVHNADQALRHSPG